MIRVNLLPIKEERRRSAGRVQLLAFTVVLLAEIAVFVFLYLAKLEDVNAKKEQVKEVRQTVESMKKEVNNAKDYKSLKAKLQKKLDVLDEIESKRGSPVKVMEELQSILTPPANEQQKIVQKQKDWNPEWDPRNLWVEKFKETRGEFELTGEAVDYDDVAEFRLRLGTADHFKNPEFHYARPTGKKAGSITIIEFKMTGQVVYETPDGQSDS